MVVGFFRIYGDIGGIFCWLDITVYKTVIEKSNIQRNGEGTVPYVSLKGDVGIDALVVPYTNQYSQPYTIGIILFLYCHNEEFTL